MKNLPKISADVKDFYEQCLCLFPSLKPSCWFHGVINKHYRVMLRNVKMQMYDVKSLKKGKKNV